MVNNIINNLQIRAKALTLSFVLATTPIAISGCQRKPSETNIEKTIEQNDLDTYMGIVFSINPDIKNDITDLEEALTKDPEDEKAKEYITKNSGYILRYFLDFFIKTTMCDANNESIYEAEDYIINYEYDKYDGEKISLTKGTETYLVEDGLFKKIIKDYYNVINIDKNTAYNDIRNIALDSIEDTKRFISRYSIESTEPNIITSYFEPDVDEVVKTKKRK